MYLQNFILDLLANILDFFTMEIFTLTFFRYTHPAQKTWLRYLALGVNLIIAAIPVFPYAIPCYMVFCFFYFFFISSFRFRQSFIFWIKYEIIILLIQLFSSLICAFTNLKMYEENFVLSSSFFDYQSLTGVILTYIFINLYIHTKRLKTLQIKTIYPVIFSFLSIGIVFLMLFFNNILSVYQELTTVLPWIYVSVSGILILGLSAYRRITEILEEQLTQKLMIDKYETELAYFGDVQHATELLSRLRHDFKNHLLVLDSYAAQGRTQALREYITSLAAKLETSRLISTPDNLISAILNAKNAACHKLHIKFVTNCIFSERYFSDFAAIVILGNIIDNAITAAAQTGNGKIELSLLQIDHFFHILCQNNHNGIIREKNGIFLSTKEDTGTPHGLGIGNVQNCVASLNGSIKIDYTDTTFTVEILLPNHGEL